jgi:N-acetylglucosaminyl-diphospho-decaprenol L-rhamnosyltransferase
MSTLSILIVHFETPELLDSLLGQLADSDAEVIIVDNASSAPETAAVLDRWASRATVIRNQQNVGFAAATNQAFRMSSGDFVMTLNPDARVSTGAIAAAMGYMNSSPGVGLVGPQSIIRELPRTCRPLLVRRRWPKGQTPLTEPMQSDWLIGTGLVCRRVALDRSFLFEESLFLFGEEFELGWHIKQRGFSLVALPLFVVHLEIGGSYRDIDQRFINRLRTCALWRGRHRYYGWRSAASVELVALADSLFLYLADLLRRRESATEHSERARTALGLILGGERFVESADANVRAQLAEGSS